MSISFELVSGIVFGIEYFEADEEGAPFSVWLHLGFVRVQFNRIID
jgi:hypothetical protein